MKIVSHYGDFLVMTTAYSSQKFVFVTIRILLVIDVELFLVGGHHHDDLFALVFFPDQDHIIDFRVIELINFVKSSYAFFIFIFFVRVCKLFFVAFLLNWSFIGWLAFVSFFLLLLLLGRLLFFIDPVFAHLIFIWLIVTGTKTDKAILLFQKSLISHNLHILLILSYFLQ